MSMARVKAQRWRLRQAVRRIAIGRCQAVDEALRYLDAMDEAKDAASKLISDRDMRYILRR